MEGLIEKPGKHRDRKNERGAALVTVMMISFLLLVAVIALLLEVSMNTANVTDATSEEQAYYAAESGIQTVVDVLRGNTCPDPLFTGPCYPIWDTDPTHVTSLPNRIDYFKAIKLATSNAPTDPSTRPRLSRWLPYTDVTNPDSLVELGGAGSRFRFKIEVENPDNIGNEIAYSTAWQTVGTAVVPPPCVPAADSIVCNDPSNGNSVTFRYIPVAPPPIDVSSGEGPASLGQWEITGGGSTFDTNGATVLQGSTAKRIRFAIAVNLTVPFQTTRIIRGYIEKGSGGKIMPNNIGTVRIFYDSKNYVALGSLISIESPGVLIQEDPPATPTGEGGTYRAGYETTPNPPAPAGVAGVTNIDGKMTAPEPVRIMIKSTGYGPRGAVKRLEAVIQKNYFNGLGAPSPLTLIGPCVSPPVEPCPAPTNVSPAFVFEPGSSTGTRYDGKDVLLRAFLPPIGLTNDENVLQVRDRLIKPPPNKFNGAVFGVPENIRYELPHWLQNPRNLHDTLMQLRAVADASDNLYEVGEPRPAPGGGNYGDFNTASGITYIEGDLEFSQQGGGILVVSGGKLTFKGGFSFNGLVIVTGRGGIQRTGGGNGSLQGNMIVAPYDDWSRTACMADTTTPIYQNKLNCFYAPRYDISGGGTSSIQYNSNNVKNGLGALTNFVKGVAEK